MSRVAVIGAGPVGLEAALAAIERGHDVTVFEKNEVGSSLRRWGPARFFSPFGMNVSDRVKALLGPDAPPDDTILAGPEFVERVLIPIASKAPLKDCLRTKTQVVQIGRDRMLRRDRPGHPLRAERAFSLLIETGGEESVHMADVVLDCSGSYLSTYVGAGGQAAIGERKNSARFVHYLGDLNGRLSELAGRHVMVVGAGHSAATAIVWLDEFCAAHPGTHITWVVRSLKRRPCLSVASDPLPERKRIVDAANDLAQTPPEHLTVLRRVHITAAEERDGRLTVSLTGNKTVTVDLVAGMTGYRPDLAFHSELAVETSPVSEGNARLFAALSHVVDCLSVPKPRPEDLQTGEPGFFMLGFKSYGRMPSFLLKDGIEQVNTVLDSLDSGKTA